MASSKNLFLLFCALLALALLVSAGENKEDGRGGYNGPGRDGGHGGYGGGHGGHGGYEGGHGGHGGGHGGYGGGHGGHGGGN